MESSVQKAVIEFEKKFGDKPLNIKNLISYVHSEFNCNVFFYDDTNFSGLMNDLDVLDFSKDKQGFTYKSRNCTSMLISLKLSYPDRIGTMLHEIGHLLMGHLDAADAEADDQWAETQASAFAYQILVLYENKKGSEKCGI